MTKWILWFVLGLAMVLRFLSMFTSLYFGVPWWLLICDSAFLVLVGILLARLIRRWKIFLLFYGLFYLSFVYFFLIPWESIRRVSFSFGLVCFGFWIYFLVRLIASRKSSPQ